MQHAVGLPRHAPALMAAFTALGFCAAALVGAFLRITTWSQSWPFRFILAVCAVWDGPGLWGCGS